MAGIIKHVFQSTLDDTFDATLVQPSNWNDYLTLTGGNKGALLLRDTDEATYGGSWLSSVSSGQVLVSAGVGSLPAWSASPTLTSVTLGTSGILQGGTNLVEQRNGTNAQRWNLSNTYASSISREDFSVDWQTTANVASIGTRTAATGNGRAVALSAQASNGNSLFAAVNIQPLFSAGATLIRSGYFTTPGGTTKATANFGGSGTFMSVGEYTNNDTSGIIVNVAIQPTYNQTSGTAANTDLLIKRTKTAVGSGLQKFLDAQVGTTVTFSVYDDGTIYTKGVAFASLPAAPIVGMLAYVSDSNTATWGATIAGSGSNNVLAFYNGSAWTVVGK